MPQDQEFAQLAHDLSQILWAIQGRARTLALELAPPASDAIALIAEDAAAAAAMLAGAGEALADPQVVARAAWRQTLDRAAAMAAPAGDCRLDGPGPSEPVAMPVHVLRRILGNLFANAVEARCSGVTVTCKSSVAEGRLRLEVSDDGPGIDPRLRSQIFTAGASSSSKDGRGLGLYGARTLARAWGGELVCRDTAVGASFVLTIPLAVASLSEHDTTGACCGDAGPGPSEVIGTEPTGLNVLVVDDDPSVREMLRNLLVVLGHRPALAGDYDEALSRCAAGCYDVALVDLGLPGRSGHELARQLREQDGALAIVLLTGWGREQELAAMPADHVDLTGVKPIDLPQLRRLLAHAARLTAARRNGCDPEAR